MSIAAPAISEAAIAAQADSSLAGRKPSPPKRTIVANADAVAQPEPR
jgi:hypothetical protein